MVGNCVCDIFIIIIGSLKYTTSECQGPVIWGGIFFFCGSVAALPEFIYVCGGAFSVAAPFSWVFHPWTVRVAQSWLSFFHMAKAP